MASRRRTPEQIIAKLREAEVGLAQGRPESPNDSFGVTFGFRANVRGIISAEPPCDLLLDLVRQVSEVGLQVRKRTQYAPRILGTLG